MIHVLVWLWQHPAEFVAMLTAIGVFLAFWTLKANHNWNRRHYALNMTMKWNSETLVHRKAIEKVMPGLIDVDKQSRQITELSKERATQIYLSDPQKQDQRDDWELRFHFLELLNFFEDISIAYLHCVADQKIIEEAFKSVLIRWYDILLPFMTIVKENRGYDPWSPYTDVIHRWKRPRRRLRWAPA